MSTTKHLVAAALALAGVTSAQAAYLQFSGIDINGNPNVQVAPTNSSAAEASFTSNLVGTGTENFETRSGSAPLALDFGAAGTATLNGGGTVATNNVGATNGFGRYSVPGGTRFWETTAGGGGNFSISFSKDIAAFGFYGIDIGDFNGSLQMQLLDAFDTVVATLNVPAASAGVADGSILYFGIIAGSVGEQFRKINFLTTTGSGDVFAFDSFTIGTREQVRNNVPEPGSLALVGLGLLGAFAARRRRA